MGAEGHLKAGDRWPPEREPAEALNVFRPTPKAAIEPLEHVGSHPPGVVTATWSRRGLHSLKSNRLWGGNTKNLARSS